MTADVHSCLVLTTILSILGLEMDWHRKRKLRRRLEDAESTLKAHGFVRHPESSHNRQ